MENLGIDPKLLLAQIVNFILFFIIVKKFILKPFNLFLDQEKKQEKEKEKALADIKKTEENLALKEQKLKEKSRKDLDAVLEEAKKESEQIKTEMLKTAGVEVAELRERTQKQLADEKDNLYRELKDKIASVSVSIVNDGLKDALDENDRKKVTRRMIANLK